MLLATNTRWYLYQALGSNFLCILPWAIVVNEIELSEERAWTYYSIIFGGALVFDFFDVGIVALFWAWKLTRGKITLRRIHSTLRVLCKFTRPENVSLNLNLYHEFYAGGFLAACY